VAELVETGLAMSWLEAGPAQEVHTVSGDVARSGVRVDRVSLDRAWATAAPVAGHRTTGRNDGQFPSGPRYNKSMFDTLRRAGCLHWLRSDLGRP